MLVARHPKAGTLVTGEPADVRDLGIHMIQQGPQGLAFKMHMLAC